MRLSDLAIEPLNRLSFALGCTSYVIPADIVTNVRALAPFVDDVELILFESPVASNMLADKDMHSLRELANEYGITYTVHLPTEHRAGVADPCERQRYVASARRVIEICAPLEPRAWIAHLEGVSHDTSRSERESWISRCGESLQAIIKAVSHPKLLAVENLGYPWQWHKKLAVCSGAGLCCDVGHLWLYFPEDWQTQLKDMLPHTSVIHLHGMAAGRDHISLRQTHLEDVRAFLECLWRFKYAGIVTLEVFTENDFAESAQTVKDSWESLSREH